MKLKKSEQSHLRPLQGPAIRICQGAKIQAHEAAARRTCPRLRDEAATKSYELHVRWHTQAQHTVPVRRRLKHEWFQEKCCQTKYLKLNTAVEIAQQYESTAHNMNMLINPTSDQTSIMYTEQRQPPRLNPAAQSLKRNHSNSTYTKQCNYCGRNCKKKDTCRAKGQNCLNINKMDHFASMCRSKKAQVLGQQQNKQIRHIDTATNQNLANKYPLDEGEYFQYLRYKQAQQFVPFAVEMELKPIMAQEP